MNAFKTKSTGHGEKNAYSCIHSFMHPFNHLLLLLFFMVIFILTYQTANAQYEQSYKSIFAGQANIPMPIFGLQKDSKGNFIIIGKYQDYQSVSIWFLFTVKLTPEGDTLWTRKYLYNNIVPLYSGIRYVEGSLILDNEDNIYITYRSHTPDSTDPSGYSSGTDIVTIKYDGSGNLLWANLYGQPGFTETERPRKIILDDSLNVYIVGRAFTRALIIKYDKDGNFLWSINPDAGVPNFGLDIIVDNDGNIIASGTRASMKVTPSGEIIWLKLNPVSGLYVQFDNILIDKNNNIYFSGPHLNSSIPVFSTRIYKYDPSGNVLWGVVKNNANSLSTGGDALTSMKWDAAGDICIASGFYETVQPMTYGHFNVGKFKTTGEEVWFHQYTGEHVEGPLDLQINKENNNIYVTANIYDSTLVNYNRRPNLFIYKPDGELVKQIKINVARPENTGNGNLRASMDFYNIVNDVSGDIYVSASYNIRLEGYHNWLQVFKYKPDQILPNPPSLITAQYLPQQKIKVSVFDNSIIETGFELERRKSTDSTWLPVDTLSPFEAVHPNIVPVIYIDSINIEPGPQYIYRVRAFNSNGVSEWIVSDGTIYMIAPTNLNAGFLSGTQIRLSWVDNSTFENGFKIERKLHPDSTFEEIGMTGSNGTTFIDNQFPAPAPVSMYSYRVREYFNNFYSEYSNTASVVFAAPLAPDSLRVNVPEIGTAVLSWIRGSGNSEGYVMERSVGSSANFTLLDSIPAGDTAYTDLELTAGTTYWYRMYAYNRLGNSPYSDTVFILITGDITGNNEIPQTFALYQNYPNPFNPITQIRFDLPHSSHVRLMIYDILGREIATLVNEIKPGGRYNIDWNAGSFSSGVYFYKLDAGEFVDIKRLVLLK